jgi:hypothetical protein
MVTTGKAVWSGCSRPAGKPARDHPPVTMISLKTSFLALYIDANELLLSEVVKRRV